MVLGASEKLVLAPLDSPQPTMTISASSQSKSSVTPNKSVKKERSIPPLTEEEQEKIFIISDECLSLLSKINSLNLDKKLTIINIINHFLNYD